SEDLMRWFLVVLLCLGLAPGDGKRAEAGDPGRDDRGTGEKGKEEPTYRGKPLKGWIKSLEDGDAFARERAVEALGKIGASDPEAVRALSARLRDKSQYVRMRAAEALGRLGPKAKGAAPALSRALADDDAKYVRDKAAQALGQIGTSDEEAVTA